jgi:pimeloyl-ACP methyl ester carboxylesterase
VPHSDADYERWIVDEVPAAAALGDDRITPDSPLFIAGLSMGGFGALRLGAKYPDRFRGISAHSAVTTLGRLDEVIEERLDALPGSGQPTAPRCTGWRPTPRGCRRCASTAAPTITCCPATARLHAALDARGIEHQYEEFAGGHDWPYWRLHLADTLRFLDRVASSAADADGVVRTARPRALRSVPVADALEGLAFFPVARGCALRRSIVAPAGQEDDTPGTDEDDDDQHRQRHDSSLNFHASECQTPRPDARAPGSRPRRSPACGRRSWASASRRAHRRPDGPAHHGGRAVPGRAGRRTLAGRRATRPLHALRAWTTSWSSSSTRCSSGATA